jgi:cobalt/nickel transport system ATP-binding protein
MSDTPLVAVRGLTFSYPGRPALHEIAFEVRRGERIGLVGPNGAGKTTLFLCLAGVLGLKPGMANVAGLDPAVSAERKQLPTRVGIVFQNSDDQLFAATLADDVAFGPLNLGLPQEEVRQRVEEALTRVDLTALRDRAPYHLSGGEKRRAALAGVLAMRPELLLLDEPSIFLDPRGRRELIRWLGDWSGSAIIASHDLDLVLDTCSRVIVLEAGKLVADGETRQILGDATLMELHGLESPHRLAR